MSVFKLYSHSNKSISESFNYDKIPSELRIQLIHTWNEYFSQEQFPPNIAEEYIAQLASIIKKEHSLIALPDPYYRTSLLQKIEIYFQQIEDTDKALDIVQLFCICIDISVTQLSNMGYSYPLSKTASETIQEINERFRLKGIGYQYTNGKIIRLDNQFLHNEAVEKTFNLLNDPEYKNVNEEFLTAHDHFKHGRKADSLVWCLKAYESIIKIIASKNNWDYDKNANANKLTDLLFKNNFFPSFLEQAINNFRAFLENSTNTIRNKKGGHGSGVEANEVPDSLAQYMLYITGSTLNLFIETQKERK